MLEALIGGGASILGGLLGSSSASKQANAQIEADKQARELYDDETLKGMARSAQAFYGSGAEDYLRSALGSEQYARLFGTPATSASFGDSDRARIAEIDSEIKRLAQVRGVAQAGTNRQKYADQVNALNQERQSLMAKAGGKPGTTGILDTNAFRQYASANPGYLDQMRTISADEEGRGNSLLGTFDADSMRLAGMGNDIANSTKGYGEQERKRIALQRDRMLTGLNRMTESKMIGSGLNNSTLMTQALQGNTRQVQESADNAFGNLNDRQIQMLAQIQGQNLANEYQRSSQGTALRSGLLDRNLSLRTSPLQAQMDLTTSGLMNPYLGRDTRFSQGASASGAAQGVLANSLAGVGSTFLGYGLGRGAGNEQNAGAALPTNSGMFNNIDRESFNKMKGY
jgi:hypothetical protein